MKIFLFMDVFLNNYTKKRCLLRRNYLIKNVYVELITARYSWVDDFLKEVLASNNHLFWGACRDNAREILINAPSTWNWLADRVDDFGGFVEESIRKKLPKWLFRANLGIGGLAKHIDDISSTISWLMDRYINEMKNLFDSRYKNYIDISTVFIVDYEEGKCCNTYLDS